MNKKTLALAYELNDNDINLFIEQVKKYKKEISVDKYLIFYFDLSESNINFIKNNCDCDFIKLNRFIKTRFEIFKYLSKYKYIILTNISFNITNDFIEKYKIHNFSTIFFNNIRFVEANFKKLIRKYHMFEVAHDTTIMFITDKIKNYNHIRNWCIYIFYRYRRKMINRVDATIELIIQKFNIDVEPITIESNSISNIKYDYKFKKISEKVDGPLVSIIMSIYNKDKYYKKAIESVLNQTYENIELIIVLEYSDIQDKIYNQLVRIKDKRINIIKNKTRLGFAESLNIGIRASRGKFIARVDDDDICVANRIEKQVNYFKNNKDVAIVGTYMKFFGQSNLICKLPTEYEELKIICLYKTPLFHPTVMFNLNIISKKDIYYRSKIYSEDYDLWSKLIDKYKIANLPEILYYYRLNGENNSTSNEKLMNESHLDIMKYQLKKFLNLHFSFDDLQMLSGRIDVLGLTLKRKYVYQRKIKLWKKIEKKNKYFYSKDYIELEIDNIRKYYQILNEKS